MSDEAAEFAQFTATLSSAPAEVPASVPATEQAPADQPKTDAEEAAKLDASNDAEKKEEPKKDWRELAAKEKERREAKRAEKAAQAQRQAEYEAALAKAKRLEEIEALRDKDPLAAAEKLGMTVEQLNTKYLARLDGAQDAEKQAMVERLAKLEQTIEAERAARAAAEQAAKEAERQEIERRRESKKAELFSDFDNVISANPDFEIVGRAPEGKEEVLDLLAAFKAKHGRPLDLKTAMEVVTEKLTERYRPIATARQFQSATQKPASGISTLTSDMRQSEPRQITAAEEDSEFMKLAFRLHNQQPA